MLFQEFFLVLPSEYHDRTSTKELVATLTIPALRKVIALERHPVDMMGLRQKMFLVWFTEENYLKSALHPTFKKNDSDIFSVLSYGLEHTHKRTELD